MKHGLYLDVPEGWYRLLRKRAKVPTDPAPDPGSSYFDHVPKEPEDGQCQDLFKGLKNLDTQIDDAIKAWVPVHNT